MPGLMGGDPAGPNEIGEFANINAVAAKIDTATGVQSVVECERDMVDVSAFVGLQTNPRLAAS